MHWPPSVSVSLLLLLVACSGDPDPKDAEAFCADLATQSSTAPGEVTAPRG